MILVALSHLIFVFAEREKNRVRVLARKFRVSGKKNFFCQPFSLEFMGINLFTTLRLGGNKREMYRLLSRFQRGTHSELISRFSFNEVPFPIYLPKCKRRREIHTFTLIKLNRLLLKFDKAVLQFIFLPRMHRFMEWSSFAIVDLVVGGRHFCFLQNKRKE